uniref:Cathepsin propeptide inhibitor domain-containing protein n=1 Tax=Ananas comosus var. bracteatus TaxID=296719 RepID=A0A6V7NZN3_ANACO|nr:unnamed protein product [Ananas comosus var. bracteatus]
MILVVVVVVVVYRRRLCVKRMIVVVYRRRLSVKRIVVVVVVAAFTADGKASSGSSPSLSSAQQQQDGTIIRGQNEISHPTNGRTEPINKDSASCSALPSRIKRVFYMSSEGSNLLHEVFPEANPTVLEQLSKVDCIVYAMGSLYTSICPSLVLHGIGESIASRAIPKVLLLNGSHDRETAGLSASSFVTAITDALNRTYGDPVKSLKNPPSDYINALLVPRDGLVPVDIECLAAQGIFRAVNVDSVRDPEVGIIFDPKSLINVLTNLICEQRLFNMASSTTATRFLLLFFLLSAASATASAARTARNSTSTASVRRMHEQWMAQHGRVYKDAAEKERRFRIFKANVEYIESANRAGNRSYTLGPNRFTDLTNEEFRASYLGFWPTSRPNAAVQSPFRYADDSTPDSMDWRSRGAVTPIKDQGDCGYEVQEMT